MTVIDLLDGLQFLTKCLVIVILLPLRANNNWETFMSNILKQFLEFPNMPISMVNGIC